MKNKLKVAEIAKAVFGVVSAALCFYSGARQLLNVIEEVKSKKEK